MMKITEYGAIRSGAEIKKRRRAGSVGDSSFADMLSAAGESAEAVQASGTGDVSATAALNNMLALQEISEEDVQRKKLVQKGTNLLDSLDELRQRLLLGTVPLATLQQLSRQLSVQRQLVSDQKLIAIIDEIELRAAVELAKLEMAASPRPLSPEER